MTALRYVGRTSILESMEPSVPRLNSVAAAAVAIAYLLAWPGTAHAKAADSRAQAPQSAFVLSRVDGDPCSRIPILRIGRAQATTVLVLIPGYGAGAGLFRATARDLVSNSADLQVWLPERREQNLIVAGNSSSKHGCSIATANPSSWGLKATLGDLRRVIAEASNRGRRRIVLGGHSWGATEALTYAAWDFDGRAGYRDLAGLLLIDGGVHDSFAGEGIRYRLTQEQAALRLKKIKSDSPFDNILSQLVGSNAPESAGRTYKAA